jgi:hypothetical protein
MLSSESQLLRKGIKGAPKAVVEMANSATANNAADGGDITSASGGSSGRHSGCLNQHSAICSTEDCGWKLVQQRSVNLGGMTVLMAVAESNRRQRGK